MIRTERLIIEPLEAAMQQHVDWLNNQDLMRFSEQRHVQHSLQSQQLYVSLNESLNIRTDDIETVGTLTIHRDVNNNTVDLGIMIGVAFGGRGFGTEAFTAISDWLISDRFFRKVEAGCMLHNLPMVKIMAASGFVLEGRRAQHFILEKQPTKAAAQLSDMLYFGKFLASKKRIHRYEAPPAPLPL